MGRGNEIVGMIKGIIFDLDGVLCSTDEYHYRAWKAIADKLQIDFSQQKNHSLRGVSRMESLEIILQTYPRKLSDTEKNQLCEEKNTLYRKSLQGLAPEQVDHAVRETLGALRKRGISLAVGSSSKNAQVILAKLYLTPYFDIIVDGNDIQNSKPAPDVFALAALGLKIPPCQCLVVEDAVAGIAAAHAANMRCAALGRVAHQGGAEFNIKSIRDILTIVTEEESHYV